MNKRITTVFLILVLTQAFHSIEEYFGKLWDVFPPAKYLTGLISSNNETGFLIANIGLFIFGIFCWALPVKKGYTSAIYILWLWIIIEIINGIGHPIWALFNWSYEPGLITAPLLFLLALLLAKELIKFSRFSI